MRKTKAKDRPLNLFDSGVTDRALIGSIIRKTGHFFGFIARPDELESFLELGKGGLEKFQGISDVMDALSLFNNVHVEGGLVQKLLGFCFFAPFCPADFLAGFFKDAFGLLKFLSG